MAAEPQYVVLNMWRSVDRARLVDRHRGVDVNILSRSRTLTLSYACACKGLPRRYLDSVFPTWWSTTCCSSRYPGRRRICPGPHRTGSARPWDCRDIFAFAPYARTLHAMSAGTLDAGVGPAADL